MPEDLRTEDCKIISRMMKDSKSQAEIARTIGFSKGTISKGTISKGTISKGTISKGTISKGTISKGTISKGTISKGTISKGTISKELNRSSGKRSYRPRPRRFRRKHSKPAQKSVITESLPDQIIVRLESEHSPEQISGGLALTGQQVSTSTIYRHLREDKKASGQLHLNLRINGHRR